MLLAAVHGCLKHARDVLMRLLVVPQILHGAVSVLAGQLSFLQCQLAVRYLLLRIINNCSCCRRFHSAAVVAAREGALERVFLHSVCSYLGKGHLIGP